MTLELSAAALAAVGRSWAKSSAAGNTRIRLPLPQYRYWLKRLSMVAWALCIAAWSLGA